MKIIQITPAYKPAYIYGGPTMSIAKLCEALVEGENEVEVFTTSANGKSELNVELGKKTNVDSVPVTYFKRLTKDHTHFSPALLWALYKEIKEQRARSKVLNPQHITHNSQHITRNTQLIIHIHSWWNLVAILSCLIAKIYNVPVVLSPRGMLTHYTQSNRNSFFKSILHILMGKSLLKYCHILASTAQEKQDILQIIKPKSISILPNLVSLPLSEQGLRNKEQEVGSITHNPQPTTHNYFSLLFLSRIEEKKGLEILFEALAQVDIDWQLTIAGEGEEKYVESLKLKAESLRVNNRIKWIGYIKNEDKFELLAQHDLLVLTSYNENFANVVIESLSMGTPVLLSKQVGLSNFVAKQDLGFITGLTCEEVKTNLDEAYNQVQKRERIRSVAPEIIKNEFDDQLLAKKYIQLYQQILSSN